MSRNCVRMFAAMGALLFLGVLVPMGWAETIRLKDDTTIEGRMLRVDDDQVLIGLPREAIRTVDGKPLPPALTAGVAAPAFSAHDLQGVLHTVGKDQAAVTVLHFWISWCPHCRSDAPKMQALYEKFQGNTDVHILTVSLDEERAPIDRFVQAHHVAYPVMHAAAESALPGQPNVPELYQITGFPMTFIVDAHGIIRHKFSGSFAESGKDLEQLITEMLASGSKNPPKPAHKT